MKEVYGNLITMALEGDFDIIIQGCNCFNTFGRGLAKEIRERLPKAYAADCKTKKGDMNKLGNYSTCVINTEGGDDFMVINCYTQYMYSNSEPQIDYEALTLCLRKINNEFKGAKIGVPLIGAGLAGGDWFKISEIIDRELKDLDVTIVKFKL
jgi:O-acetyl-ADP-ribose deacetylase (regulator of RNase III)